MTIAVPAPVFPEANRILNVAVEAVKGTLAAGAYTSVPVADFSPDPDFSYFYDEALRGAMTGHYDAEQGPAWVTSSVKESPLYGDTILFFLAALFGEWTVSGTAQETTWTATGGAAAGATSITVTSGTSATEGTYVQMGTTGSQCEVVKVGADSTETSIVLDPATPLRFAYSGSTTVTLVEAPYTWAFAVMNPASPTGSISGQGPSLSVLDRNFAAGPDGYYADAYPYTVVQEITLTGMPNGYLTWAAKLLHWPQASPGAAVTPAFSGVKGIPAWKGTSEVADSTVDNIGQWTITLTREVNEITAINGQQAPLAFALGKLTGTFDTDYVAVSDESALELMTENTQPSLDWTTSNGLSGSSEVSFEVSALYGAATKAPLTVTKTLFGYKLSGDLIANETDTGPSGGFGPCTVSVTNAVPVLVAS